MSRGKEKDCNWNEHEFNKNNTTSIVLYECLLKANLDIGRMNDAWEYVVRSHENLQKTIRIEASKTSSVFMKANATMGESHKKIEYLKNIDISAFLEMITNQDDGISLKSVPFRLWFIINKDDLYICLKLPRSMADNRSMQIVINDLLQLYDDYESHQSVLTRPSYTDVIFATQDVKIENHNDRKLELKQHKGGLSIPVEHSRDKFYLDDPCGVITASIFLKAGAYKRPEERSGFINKAMVASIFGLCEMRSVDNNSISPYIPLLDFEIEHDYRNIHSERKAYEDTMGNFSFDIGCSVKNENKNRNARDIIQKCLWNMLFEDKETGMPALDARIYSEYPAKRDCQRDLASVRQHLQGFTSSVGFSFNFIEKTKYKLCEIENVYFSGGHQTPLRAAYIINFTFVGTRACVSVLFPKKNDSNKNKETAERICKNILDAVNLFESQSDYGSSTLEEFKRHQRSKLRHSHSY